MRRVQFQRILVFFLIEMRLTYSNLSGERGVQYNINRNEIVDIDNPKVSDRMAVKLGPPLRDFDKKFALCGPDDIDIRELSIAQAQVYFHKRQLCSTRLTLCYLKRILVMNPYLKAVIEVNVDVVKIAMKADMERFMGIVRGPLHGIPVLIKDNIATSDRMQTTVGSMAMQYLMPREDAEVVKRLRSAGAVILGKSNPSEWADFRGTNIPGGWSGRGGQTRSPYVLSSDPSGSSTGSAVAVAANLAMVAVGTETDGSIVSPASLGSCVGLKTTLGTVSTKGIIALSFSQDVIGPIARSATDAEIVLNVIADKISDINTFHPKQNIPKGFKIGIIRNPFWNSTDAIISRMIPQLNMALKMVHVTTNATVIEIDPAKEPCGLLNNITSQAELIVLLHEFKFEINKYLKDVNHLEFLIGQHIHSLSDIIRFNARYGFRGYNQDYLIAAERTDGINNQTYKNARDLNKAISIKYLNKVLDGNRLDVIAGPCNSEATLLLHNLGSIAGYPSITVPVGATENGIPFGICFLGRMHSERMLLEIARMFEDKLVMRKMPRFVS